MCQWRCTRQDFVCAPVEAHHGQAVALVAEHDIGQELGRSTHCDALAVVQLIQPALHITCSLEMSINYHTHSMKAYQVSSRSMQGSGSTHLLTQIPLPELTVCCSSSHSSQQVRVDFYDLLYCL